MNLSELRSDHAIVYCWRWNNQTVCKIGKSTVGRFKRYVIDGSARWCGLNQFDLLGFEVFETETEAYNRERELLNRFNRVRSNGEWVYINKDVLDWIDKETFMILVSTFKEHDNRKKKSRYDESKRHRSKPGYKERKNMSERKRMATPEGRQKNREYHRMYREEHKEHLSKRASERCYARKNRSNPNQLTLFDGGKQ